MPVKVLVVDDSLFMKTLISDMLNSDPEIKVIDTAKNGIDAIKKIGKMKPDCITLDLAMPVRDGLTTLSQIMNEYPTPVVILSAYSRKDADITMKCLNAGAIGFVLKPSGELSLDIKQVRHQLIEEVKAASKANVGRIESLIEKKPRKERQKQISEGKIVVIGASTGGPQTLKLLLPSLPRDFSAPIVVAQHVPTDFFTQSLAKDLNNTCELKVKVMDNNDAIQAGSIYLIPSGFQMKLTRRDTQSVVSCLRREKAEDLSPSIDLTMKTLAQVYKENTVGIILSGMGNDGVEGMKTIKEAGGRTIVQDESSLIFGMPKAVHTAGYADRMLPVSEIVRVLVDLVNNS